ncbi:MAG: sulfite exporter TauE/SafE family protein [Peptococcaceae bacterium]|nr:sulfite exporter TauE/SafE family protein [Peptococcaceae bacterium]
MQGVIVFFIVVFACSLGSVSGIGGGIIIKPLMDALGGFSAAHVNAMTSITILTMTTVSIIKSRRNALSISWRVVAFFIVGSILGGILGNLALARFIAQAASDATVVIVQSLLQILFVLVVMAHELFKSHIPHFKVKNPFLMGAVGVGMGIIAAFLSIGGGLMNRPLLIILLSMTSKSAVFTSLCIIFCAQASNVITMGVTTHFSNVEPVVMLFMMAGAIIGGYVGGAVATKVNDKYFDRLFFITLVVILCINAGNLLRHFI